MSDDYEDDVKDQEILSTGQKTKSTWNAGEYLFKTLGKCKEAFFQYNHDGNIEQMFWLVRMELALYKSYFIKKHELIKNVESDLYKAENLLFNRNVNKNIQVINRGLAIKYILDAWENINTLEAVNGLLQPISKSPEQKIRQYGN